MIGGKLFLTILYKLTDIFSFLSQIQNILIDWKKKVSLLLKCPQRTMFYRFIYKCVSFIAISAWI